jgi:HlyD family secretion protein
VRVPTAALIEGGQGDGAANADSGKLEERKVKAGMANWEFTEVARRRCELEPKAKVGVVTSLERAGVKAGANVHRPPGPPCRG